MSRRGWFLTALLAIGLLVAVPIFALYRPQLDAARRRVAAGGAVVATPCGPIQYAVFGQGPAVLMVHGRPFSPCSV